MRGIYPRFYECPQIRNIGGYAIRDGFLEKETHGLAGAGGCGLGAVKTFEIKKGLMFFTKECVYRSRTDWKQVNDFKHIRGIMNFAFKKDRIVLQGQTAPPSDILRSSLPDLLI